MFTRSRSPENRRGGKFQTTFTPEEDQTIRDLLTKIPSGHGYLSQVQQKFREAHPDHVHSVSSLSSRIHMLERAAVPPAGKLEFDQHGSASRAAEWSKTMSEPDLGAQCLWDEIEPAKTTAVEVEAEDVIEADEAKKVKINELLQRAHSFKTVTVVSATCKINPNYVMDSLTADKLLQIESHVETELRSEIFGAVCGRGSVLISLLTGVSLTLQSAVALMSRAISAIRAKPSAPPLEEAEPREFRVQHFKMATEADAFMNCCIFDMGDSDEALRRRGRAALARARRRGRHLSARAPIGTPAIGRARLMD